MADEGALLVTLVAPADRVEAVRLQSTRRTDFSRLLVGLPVDGALQLVPSLFSICAAAQAVAGLEACEGALGLTADAPNRALRRVLAALEGLENHAFQLFVEWPRLQGQGPDAARFRSWRAATQALRQALVGPLRWAVPGGVALGPPGPLPVGALRAAVEGALPASALASLEAARAWTAAQPGVRAAAAAGALALGATGAPLVPPAEPAWFQARLEGEATFGAAPTLDGAPAESGAISLVAGEPVLEAALAAGGRTVEARLVARLLDVHRLLALVEALAPTATGGAPSGQARRATGAGAGVADTSRGRLAHAVAVEGGRVAAWRTVAPTEWSFHPQGVVVEALLGQPLGLALAAAPFLVAALDPCVACRVEREP